MGGRVTRRRAGRCLVGTSGYQYPHWRHRFYPGGVRRADWLGYYAARFDTVEVNATFYGLPEPATVEAWRAAAPPGFVFALKFSRYGSHLKRLREPRDTIRAFLERADLLGAALGPILVQLPPRWGVDVDRLAAFVEAAPARCRWAFEFRDPSWLCAQVYAVLRRAGAALCIHDMLPDHPRIATADWLYLRFHGDHYTGSYSSQLLAAQARWIRRELAAGRDVYAYFNNDAEAHAPANAAELARYVRSPR